jgi:hypothetical protein
MAALSTSVCSLFLAGRRTPFNEIVLFQIYSAWETDDVIGYELWRNLLLAMVTVLVITTLMLADVKLCSFVLTCVTLTLVSAKKWREKQRLPFPKILSCEFLPGATRSYLV